MAVYSVSQVTRYVRESLEGDENLADIWINGEVSNHSVSQAGHTYFTLKDSQGQLRCVMFVGGRGGELVQNGAAIIAHGRISFYEARGQVQFMIDIIVPEGTGALHLELEKLKLKLEAEGLFDPSRKRPLPPFPRTVGVVTSPSGAVFHDICNILKRRYPLVEVVLAPTAVQGEEAAPGIVAALRSLNQRSDIDVIIVARGGGSLEELWAFNEEVVARAVYASRIPVVSAVGHETDYTICDFVADVRAPTPSAAAEMVVPDAAALRREVAHLWGRACGAFSALVAGRRHEVESLAQRLRTRAPDTEVWRRQVGDLQRLAVRALASQMELARERLQGLQSRLEALDPTSILKRGYAIVQEGRSGTIISRVGQVRPGEELSITVTDGRFPATAGGKARKKPPKKGQYAGKPLF